MARDFFGDPLPVGAVARMGTVRGRHAQSISFVAFMPDGKNVLTVGQDQLIRLWDAKSGQEIRRFGKPLKRAQEDDLLWKMPRRFRSALNVGKPFRASLSSDGKLLACGGQDGPTYLWDVASGKEISQISGPGLKIPGGFPMRIPGWMGVSNLALSSDGKILAGTAIDGTIHLWSTSTSQEIRQIAQPENQNMPVSIGSSWGPLAFSPDGKTILDSYVDMANNNFTGSLRLWDVATGKKKLEIKDQNGGMGMTKAAFSPDGKMLACGTMQSAVRFLNADTGQELGRLKGSQLWGPLVFSPDGKMLVTQDMSTQSVTIWDVKTGQESRTLVKGTSGASFLNLQGSNLIGALAFSSDDKFLALAQGHVLRILEVARGKDVFAAEGNQTTISQIHFLPDGQSLSRPAEGLQLGVNYQ